MTDNLFPWNPDAEKAVIGGIFLVNTEYYSVSDFLTPEDFYLESHRIIFAAQVDLLNSNRPVDFVIIREFLEKQKKLDLAGGIGYIATLIDGQFSAAAVGHYGRTVKRLAQVRKMKRTAHEVVVDTEHDPEKLESMLDSALATASLQTETPALSAIECAQKQVDYFDAIRTQTGSTGIKTGIYDLDIMTDGLQESEMSIWAGRPSTGKTALGVTFVRNMPDVPLLFESLEQRRTMIVNRLLAAITGIDLFRIRTKNLSAEEWATLYRATLKLSQRKFFVQDRAANLNQIRAEVKRRRRQDGIKLVIIDYFSMIRHELPKGQRWQTHEVYREIACGLKALAKDLQIHIAVLVQITRDLGPHEEPDLRHLADTRQLEQDADLVVFTWSRPGSVVDTYDNVLTIAKQRNGNCGRISVLFRKDTTSFENLTTVEEQHAC